MDRKILNLVLVFIVVLSLAVKVNSSKTLSEEGDFSSVKNSAALGGAYINDFRQTLW